MLPVNSLPQGTQVIANNLSVLTTIQQRVGFVVAAIFIVLLGLAAGMAMMFRNANRETPQPQMALSEPQQQAIQSPPSPQPTRGMETPRQQLDRINPRDFSNTVKRLNELSQTAEPNRLSMTEEKLSASVTKISAVIASKSDEAFHQRGLIRNSTDKNGKEKLKTGLLALEKDQELPQEDPIPLDIAIAVFKDLVRERNFFGGRLQSQVVDLVKDLRPTSKKRGLTEEEIVQRLQGMIAQLPQDQQRECRLFLGVLHRVSEFSEQNNVSAAVIANSLADIFSHLPVDLAVTRVGLTINTVFTELLITHFPQI